MNQRYISSDIDGQLYFKRYLGVHIMHYPHVHAGYELYFCPGDIRQKAIINGEESEYKHPCVIISIPYTVHAMSCFEDEATDFERFIFYFNDEIFSRLDFEREIEREVKDILSDKMSIIFKLDDKIAEELREMLIIADRTSRPYNDSETELLLNLFIKRLFALCPKDNITNVGRSSRYIQDAMQYIFEHLSEGITVEDILTRFSVSRSKLDRDFLSALGMSVHAFLDKCRLDTAKQLLLDKNGYSVKDVAQRCGFKNETYFFPFFKRKTGMSPNEYREKRAAHK